MNSERQTHHRVGSFMIVTTILTLSYLLMLVFQLPLFQSMPGWFWHLKVTTLDIAWLFYPLAVVSILVVIAVLKNPSHRAVNILMLILLGYALQMGFGYMEGRGIDGIRDRMVYTGHAVFARYAVIDKGTLELMRDYESLVGSELPHYPFSTKPPGTLIFYKMTKDVASTFAGSVHRNELYRLLVTFASFAWPLLTYLAVIPIYFIACLFFSEHDAMLPPLLYLFLPNVTLMTLHLDQCLYPSLAAVSALFLLSSISKHSAWRAFAAGVMLYVSFYFTLSMVVVAVLLSLMLLVHTWAAVDRSRKKGATTWQEAVSNGAKTPVLWAGGFLFLHILFRIAFEYDAIAYSVKAMSLHQGWKGTQWTLTSMAYYGFLDTIEFALWIGIPVSMLCVRELARSVVEMAGGGRSLRQMFILCFAVTFALLAFFGRTQAESARLWIFLAPFVTVFAAARLPIHADSKVPWLVLVVVFLQLLTIFAIKGYQDFY